MNLSRSHYTGIHIHDPIKIEDVAKFKRLVDEEECDIFKYLTVTRRIGSESLHATVWETVFIQDDLQIILAAKIMDDSPKTKNETDLSLYLSTNWPEYFLKTYAAVNCPEILSGSRVFSGIFMFMEFAVTDLGQLLLSNYIFPEEILGYIDNVLDSIYTLGTLQIYHGDLHVRNIFIVNRDGGRRAVIGDFGESMTGEDEPYAAAHLSDTVKFLSSLEELLRVVNHVTYYNIRKRLAAAVKKANLLTVESEDKYEKWKEDHTIFEDNEAGEEPTSLIDFRDVDKFFEELVGGNISIIREFFV